MPRMRRVDGPALEPQERGVRPAYCSDSRGEAAAEQHVRHHN